MDPTASPEARARALVANSGSGHVEAPLSSTVMSARILYGVVGEGMGHATRSKVVIEHLLARGHAVKIAVSGRAYEFLARSFDDVVEIQGLTMRYRDGAFDRDASLLKNLVLSPQMALENARPYFGEVRAFEPRLVISDFDSFSYTYGRQHGLPILSVDNQQIIHKCKHDADVKRGVLLDFQATRAFVKAKLPGCAHYVVTSFFSPPVREKYRAVTTLVPPILRRAILEARPTVGEHVLVYQTSTSDGSLVEALNQLPDQRFVVYGLRRDAVEGNCTLKGFSEDGFVRDLASARAVVTNGGLSLIHECVYLRKPIFSVPVVHQFEQEMNARYVEKLGYGLAMPKTDPAVLAVFLRERQRYEAALAAHHQDGNQILFETLDQLIATHAPDAAAHA